MRTPLDLILRNHGITNLVISGIATHVAVESTTREAFNLGYTVYTLEDCCTSTTQEIHEWSIKNTLSFFGFVIDADSLHGREAHGPRDGRQVPPASGAVQANTGTASTVPPWAE